MAKVDRFAGRETRWGEGRDLTEAATAFELHDFRRTLEQETSSLSGFRRRVRTYREWSILPMVFGVPILAFQFITIVWELASHSQGRTDATWERLADSEIPWWAAFGSLLILASLVSSEVRIRREFRFFTRDGWVALQAPTGLVEVNGEGATIVAYDYRSIGGPSEFLSRDLGKPIVLVSAPSMSVDAFARQLGAVRANTIARVFARDELTTLKQQLGKFGAVPTDGWLGDTEGCLIAQGNSTYVVTAIPRAWRNGRRVRLGRIKLRADEVSRLSGAIATPTTTQDVRSVRPPASPTSVSARRRKSVMGAFLLVAVLLVGPVMITVGSIMTAADNALLESGVRATGTVAEVRGGSKASTHRFKVDFSAADVSPHSFWVAWSPDEKPSVGDEVTVVYPASYPDHAVVEGFDGDGVSVTGLGAVFTVLFGVIGVGGFIGNVRRRAKKRRTAVSA